ncbi:6739_t:CDS:2, partial [Dentiscutata heterogama]
LHNEYLAAEIYIPSDENTVANKNDITYDSQCQFPSGDFYIKLDASPPRSPSLVVDIENSFLRVGTKVIVAQQKSDVEHDSNQLWRYEDGFLVNKQTDLCLEAETVKARGRLILHHRRSTAQINNQKWILTSEGRIALQCQPKFVLRAKRKNIVLADSTSKGFKNIQFIIQPFHPVKKCNGVVRLELVSAEGLKNVDSFLAGLSDPYVRILHADNSKDIIAQTKVIDNDLNPVWNEVHYLPVKYIGEKFILEVMDFNTIIKHRPLGNCQLDTCELIKEGTPNGIDVWSNLSIQGQIHYKAKFFTLEPLPKPTPDFLANIKEKPFGHSKLCVLITLQAPNGGIPPSDTLAYLFGFEFQKDLLNLYKSQCGEERNFKINPTVWTTSMVLWFLHFLLKDYKSEWDSFCERAEQYISKEINDIAIERTVIAIAKRAVHERFKIPIAIAKKPKVKSFFGSIYKKAAKLSDQIENALAFDKNKHDDHEKAEALIIVGESATPEKCKEIVSDQKDDGSIELSDSVCNELDVPKEEIIKTIQKKIKNNKLKSPKHSSSLGTAISISYLKNAAPQHESLWKDKYDKA